jgi:hypothetical protein
MGGRAAEAQWGIDIDAHLEGELQFGLWKLQI